MRTATTLSRSTPIPTAPARGSRVRSALKTRNGVRRGGVSVSSASPNEERGVDAVEGTKTTRRAALGALTATVTAIGFGVKANDEALAMFNADLDKPIEDGPRAIAVALAAQRALVDIQAQNDAFRDTCEAPVFACDLSQLNVKTSSRVSGPLRRALPTLSEQYGVDPYAVDAIFQNVSTLEAIFKANNARVKVDFKGGPEMIGLIQSGLNELFGDLPPDAFEAGKKILDSCDLKVDATAEGDVECRIARAVAQNKRPTGGQS
jgi:hypothetical protein